MTALYFPRLSRAGIAALLLLATSFTAVAQEAVIRKTLPARIPGFPAIKAVTKAPLPGLYEVVAGDRIVYTNAAGTLLLDGSLIDTRTRRNLTDERLQVVNAIAFKDLPLELAMKTTLGTGARKLVVFADPNCGYCKQFERDTVPHLKDVTIYTVLIPILTPDSLPKSASILCAPNPQVAWDDWMHRDQVPPAAQGTCGADQTSAALDYARRLSINRTPTLVFESGRRVPGAIAAAEVERLLNER